MESIYGVKKRKEVFREIVPLGQADIYDQLVSSSLVYGKTPHEDFN